MGFWWGKWLYLNGHNNQTDGTNKNESEVCGKVEPTANQTRGVNPQIPVRQRVIALR
jgi:hypothetical protein